MASYLAYSKHAECRAQQRRIDPIVDQWLDQYGEESYDGFGGIRVYFSKRSIRKMQKAFGREPVRRMRDKLNVYRVESSTDGQVITVGYRTKAIRA